MPSIHHVKAAAHKRSALWTECRLQTYFTAKGLIDYFVVVAGKTRPELVQGLGRSAATASGGGDPLLTKGEKAYFEKIEEDFEKVKEEVAKEAGIVHDFEDSRASHVPWLERTGFHSHLKELLDEEIYGSYKLPSDRELEGGSFDDPILARIIAGTRSLLNAAYELCSDTSPDRKMTYQRACILNEFYAGATGKSDAFRHYKMESSRVKYFNTWVQLAVYYYRVVYTKDGHFTRRRHDYQVPKDSIQVTASQHNAFEDVVQAAQSRKVDEDEDEQIATTYYSVTSTVKLLRV